MAMFEVSHEAGSDHAGVALPLQAQPGRGDLECLQCAHPLECVDHHRRSGIWLGSFFCANCRSEYFYTYRWGRLVPKG
jgi:hypothetical protein